MLLQTHGTDVSVIYGPSDLTDYLIRFATNLDPNGATGISWPQYSVDSPQLLTLLDGSVPLNITDDTFRAEGFAYLTELSLQAPS